MRTEGRDRSPQAPASQIDIIDDEEIILRLHELLDYGYGRLEVVVRDHQVSVLNWQKSLVRGGNPR